MKKFIMVFIGCFVLLCLNSAFAESPDIYVGLTGGYATDQESFNIDRVGLEDWDTCELYGGIIGIELNKYMGLEFVVDRLDHFDINSGLAGIDAEMRMTNYLIMFKLSTSPSDVRAYIRAGAGLADIGMTASMVGGGDPVFEDDETGPIMRFSIGTDMFLFDQYEGLSVGFSVNYTNGLSEVETLEYLDGQFNLCYHF